MNREQFFDVLARLDEKHLQKALWNLYWRGSADLREKIETELAPTDGKPARPAKQAVDARAVLEEVNNFVTLARAGAYMAGDRRVSPKERSRWRFTFQRLATDSRAALTVDAPIGIQAMESLIALACETKDLDHFHSDDPMEAARFVVSDAVALLWSAARDHYGFSGFAERAAPQLIRWESRYGWTRSGYGSLSQKETTLADVLARMLRSGDAWTDFAEHYLHALDQVPGGARDHVFWQSPDFERSRLTGDLSAWHLMLLERLEHSDAEEQLDRLVEHPSLGGPELAYLQARLARQRGDEDAARTLIQQCLRKLPGHQDFLDFAAEINAPLPARAQRIATERSP
jgi:hypothetical protein